MKFILADIEAVRRYIADIEAGNWVDFFGEGAEAGVNHNGDLDLARRLVDAAAAAGADAVKFQTFRADRLASRLAQRAEYQKENLGGGEQDQLSMLRKLELDEAALVSILTEPKNAITKQFKKLFEMEGVELEFRPDALAAIARKALKRKTGARGLRTIVESVLLDTMYELPSQENVSKVVVDESVIEHKTDPYLIYQTPAAAPKVASAE